MSGLFKPIMVDYEKLDAIAQAEFIINHVYKYYLKGYKKVGITYSANHDQTETIRATYENDKWYTGIQGANQARVISTVENLLQNKYSYLQQVFQILPITTIGQPHELHLWVREDLECIRKFLQEEEHVVLGWRNQDCAPNYFAIGGGISHDLTNAHLDDLVQKTLHSLSVEYAD